MKLDTEFCQLPLRLDAQRLAEEVGQFTESDWQVVFFVVDEEGDIKRGSAEGGTYTLEGDALTFRHLHNFSTGEAMEGLEEAPLRLVYRAPEDAPEEPASAYVDGDRLTLAFPSGNRLIFTRSSR